MSISPVQVLLCAMRRAHYRYLFATGYFKRQVILKQQFTIEKGYYVNDSTKKYCSTPYLLSRKMLFDCPKLLNHTYLVEQNRMANAQVLRGVWVEAFGAKLLFLLNKKR
jgi:hypothetical protein